MLINEEECKECGLCCWWDPETITGNKDALIKPNGYCKHHDDEIGCKIYDKRPQACKDYKRGGAWCLARRRLFGKNDGLEVELVK